MGHSSGAAFDTRRHVPRLDYRTCTRLLAIILFIALLGIGAVLAKLFEDRSRNNERLELNRVGITASSAIRANLDHLLFPTEALATIIGLDPLITESRFDSIASDFISTFGSIDSLQLAPNGVVSNIYPLEGNESIIGHDVLEDPLYRDGALSAIKSKSLTLSGPIELGEGRFAVIGHSPVYVPDNSGKEQFWGFTIAVIPLPALLEALGLGQLTGQGYMYEISRVIPETGERQIFASGAEEQLSNPVDFAIQLPNGVWTLAISPLEAGGSLGILISEVVLVLSISALLTLLFSTRRMRDFERQLAEQTLKESEDRFRTLVEQAAEPFYVSDIEGQHIVNVNEAACSALGYTREELLNLSLEDIAVNVTHDLIREIGQKLALGETVTWEGMHRRKDGTTFPVETRVGSITLGGQQYRFALARDISERKRAEQVTGILAEVGRIMNSSLEIEDVYDRFTKELQKLLPFDWVSNATIDADRGTVTIDYQWGPQPQPAPTGTVIPLAGSLTESVLLNRQPIVISVSSVEQTAREYPGLGRLLRRGARSFLGVPLIYRDEVNGILLLSSIHQNTYEPFHVELATRVGYHIIGAITNAQLYSVRIIAENQVRASLSEKEVLLKEINHRVKNNLQIISSLLSMQSSGIQDETALHALKVSQERIKAIAMVHDKLYRSEDVASIDFSEYLHSLVGDLRVSYGTQSQQVAMSIEAENVRLGVDIAIPCGIILNELVANSLKYAFPHGRQGEIAIRLRSADGQCTMSVKDNGVGLPADLDTTGSSSLGMMIVETLATQLGGTLDVRSKGGVEFIVTFPHEIAA